MSENLSGGIHQLHERRARRTRQAPQPRHPKLAAEAADSALTAPNDQDDAADATSSANPAADAHPAPGPSAPAPAAAIAEPIPTSAKALSAAPTLPNLNIDPADPTAHIVSPTVLSIPASIVRRFDRARADAPSHTALVLDALRAQVHDLPTLVLNRRPGPKPGDLFPFRDSPGRTTTDTPMPLRIRPTKGELNIMKQLTDWSSAQITQQRPGTRPTNRSEMVAAALDAFLPPARRKT
ncbi:type III secretion system outer membrane O domain protein [Mycobacterium intracellulare MIN_052511_1280]|nr:type III secretion system outer membrane O domain protein [Mycobacterium intracellulare MIN_052511_1280]